MQFLKTIYLPIIFEGAVNSKPHVAMLRTHKLKQVGRRKWIIEMKLTIESKTDST